MKKHQRLLFGSAGIPLSTPDRNIINGLNYLPEIGLEGMEIEFVRSINIGEEKAKEVREVAGKQGLTLTCHGQYFINLNAVEKEKVDASMQRIVKAATRAYQCGAFSMTFHAGFYLKMEKERVYDKIKGNMKKVMKELSDNNIDIWVRPETTGKATQFGDVDELARLSSEIDNVMPCIDFSHLHARSGGEYNSYDEIYGVLEKVEKHLGKEALQNMHIHMSGINYSEKGERNHLILKESDLNYKEIMRAWKDYGIKGMVISESPNIEQDAVLMKKTYENL